MCSHLYRQLYRVIISDGRTQLTERCRTCGANTRPGRPWVPANESPVPIDQLPLLEDMRAPVQGPTLFDRQ